jgi:hypothetical protein
MKNITSCFKSVFPCARRKDDVRKITQDDMIFPLDASEENPQPLIGFMMLGDDPGMGIGIVRVIIAPGNVLFDPLAEEAPEDGLPLELKNEKYNVTLKVSHAEFRQQYGPFQQELQYMAHISGTNVLEVIQKEKPAAVSVGPHEDVTLTSGLNFVSGKKNAIMPHCQMVNAIRNKHLYHTTTGELLNFREFRALEKAYESDLKKQEPVQKGNFFLRSVPGIK